MKDSNVGPKKRWTPLFMLILLVVVMLIHSYNFYRSLQVVDEKTEETSFKTVDELGIPDALNTIVWLGLGTGIVITTLDYVKANKEYNQASNEI